MSKRFNLGDKVVLIKEDNLTKKYLSKNTIYTVYSVSEFWNNRIQIKETITIYLKSYQHFNSDFFEIYDIRKERKDKLQKLNN